MGMQFETKDGLTIERRRESVILYSQFVNQVRKAPDNDMYADGRPCETVELSKDYLLSVLKFFTEEMIEEFGLNVPEVARKIK